MKQRIIVSLETIAPQLSPFVDEVSAQGIDRQHLFEYAIHYARYDDYATLAGHVMKDMVEIDPGLLLTPLRCKRIHDACMSCIEQASYVIVPAIEHLCGIPFDHHISFETFIQNDVVLLYSP